MRKIILLTFFISGCTLSAQNINTENKNEYDFNKLINSAVNNQINFKQIHKKASQKESVIVSQAINKITTLKDEVKDLRSELTSIKTKIDTIYIHDTVRVVEKKSFWGKTKIDTTSNE